MLAALALVLTLGWQVTAYALIAAGLLLTYPLFKRFSRRRSYILEWPLVGACRWRS